MLLPEDSSLFSACSAASSALVLSTLPFTCPLAGITLLLRSRERTFVHEMLQPDLRLNTARDHVRQVSNSTLQHLRFNMSHLRVGILSERTDNSFNVWVCAYMWCQVLQNRR